MKKYWYAATLVSMVVLATSTITSIMDHAWHLDMSICMFLIATAHYKIEKLKEDGE